MNGPELWLIGGPNGAGKTTLCNAEEFQSQLEGVQLLNPDQVTLRLLRQRGFASFAEAPPAVLRQANMEAADEVFRELVEGVASRRLVGVETVLSTDKYKSLVTAARALHGRFYLIYVSLASPALSLSRVQQRVRHAAMMFRRTGSRTAGVGHSTSCRGSPRARMTFGSSTTPVQSAARRPCSRVAGGSIREKRRWNCHTRLLTHQSWRCYDGVRLPSCQPAIPKPHCK